MGVNIECIDYFSGWTSIYKRHWDDFLLEHYREHTSFAAYDFVRLGIYDNVLGKQASTMVHKNGIVARRYPYNRRPLMYTPEFIRDGSVQHRNLRTTYVKKELIQMYNTDSYVP